MLSQLRLGLRAFCIPQPFAFTKSDQRKAEFACLGLHRKLLPFESGGGAQKRCTTLGESFQPFDLFGVEFRPIPVLHGPQTIYGFRFGGAAYLTDHSEIPESSMEQLQGLDVLFLDALRHKPHPTHSTVERSVKTVEQLAPRRAFFTHICHDLPHARTESRLPPHIRLAYDGLEITVGDPR